ncbi:MAG: ABC transporter permease [Candidatus Bipolaricaulota bacterium]
MKFYQVAVKGLKEIFRDQKGLGLLLAFPAIFMLVFGFAFSGGQGENSPYVIGVINRDSGAEVMVSAAETRQENFGVDLVSTLEGLTFEDGDVPLFDVQTFDDAEEGDSLLQDRDISALLIIPENFSRGMSQIIKSTIRTEITSLVGEIVINQSGTSPSASEESGPSFSPDGGLSTDTTIPRTEDVEAKTIIRGDPGYVAFGQVQGILTGVLGSFKDRTAETARERARSFFNGGKVESNNFVEVDTESISGSQSFSIFDYQAPGIFLFALLMSAIGVAGALSKEVEAGTLERLKLSKMASFDLMFGTLITWSVVAVVQVLILFAVAILIGFSWSGGITSLLLAILVAVIGGIASVALGLLIAAFSENEKHASNLGTLVSVPLSFLVGAFFPLPKLPIGKVFGSTIEIYEILPWTHAANALRTLLTFGGVFDDIVFNLVSLLILTAILFAIGVFFFSKNRLTAIR